NSSTPYPQQEATYVGSQTCRGCHPTYYDSWKETLHAWKLRPKDEANIVADFTSDDPDLTFTLDDVDYVIGASGRGWKQRFIKVMEDGGWRVLPAQWNIATQEWVPYHPDDWMDRDYKVDCVGCHTTGFDINNPEANGGLGFVDFGIACEACHGPGSQHVAGGFAGEPGNRQIVKTPSAEVCAGCHVRGKTKEGLYDVRYGWPEGYYPGSGVALEDVYDLNWGTGSWWFDNPEDAADPGHAKSHHQQYMEWEKSAHARSLEDLRASGHAQDFCLQCHSEDYRRAPAEGKPTVDTAKYPITCVTCHTTHEEGAEGTRQLAMSQYETCVQCHNGGLPESGKFEPGSTIHHPMQEMFEGIGFPGVEDMPSPHFTAEGGPVCSSCHFPRTAKSAVPGDITSHLLKIAMPGEVAEGEPDSCTGCHTGASRERMQKIIDDRQAEIRAELDELQNLLDASQAISDTVEYKTAYTAYSMVESEGSFGIHNYGYAKAILAKGFELLGQARTESPYIGSDACVACHSVITPEVVENFEDTLHNWKLRPRDEANIVGQFPVTDVNGQTWTLDDVDYVIGARPKWKQRYIKVIDGVWRILPIQWNLATEEWVPYHADTWQTVDYKVSCVGCHTTGFDINNPEANGGLGFVDFGITCEACHGPGREHASSGGDKTKIVKTPSSEVCAGCHSRGKTIEGLYDVRYGWPEGYYPGSGVALEDVYDLDWSAKRWWFDNPEDAEDPGHAKSHHQQYMEWERGGHAAALSDLIASGHAQDTCLQCHSEDARRDPENVTVDTARYSIECVTCHATHDPGTEGTSQLIMSQYETCVQCHNGHLPETGKFEPGSALHHPMKEMFEGIGFPGVEDMPSPHFTAEGGPVCSSCHFPRTAKSALPGDIASHMQTDGFAVAMPGEVAEGEPDSCTGCHTDSSRQDMQQIIDDRQATVRAKLDELQTLLDANADRSDTIEYKTAFTAHSMVQEEGSFGIHNYAYANAILDRALELLAPAEIPAGRYALTARVFIDYRCDSFFQAGVDIPLGDVPVTVSFPNGARTTLQTRQFGMAYLAGFDASDGLTVSVKLPDSYRGFELSTCPASSTSVDLTAGDFQFGYKGVLFRAMPTGETASP
ncbi:MAG: hypothetical protein D6791_09880, partial [Chloroflexi bacterium]